MCKRCSAYIDLLDYEISSAVSKNFRTKGTFILQPKGYVFNTEAVVGEAVIRGKFIGKLIAERSLTLHSTAEIKGTFTSGCLIIPASNHFHWKDQIKVGAAEISGELVASLKAEAGIRVKVGGRLFGDIEAPSVVVEGGGVLVGEARIRPSQTTEKKSNPPSGSPSA
jgi:cytoskeletal protein CcmA (bactofilin family)